jgi:hypothetical protein
MKHSITETLIAFVERHKGFLISLQNHRQKTEKEIADLLFQGLKVSDRLQSISYDGLFGWRKHDPDGYFLCSDSMSDLVVEIKKVTEGGEYGYWHALIQGLIYAKRHKTEYQTIPCIICVVLDWGRKAGKSLDSLEQEFIDHFVEDNIHTIRVNMVDSPFIEHNLYGGGKWTKI